MHQLLFRSLLFLLLLASLVTAGLPPSHILVSIDFESDALVSGPDTFSVFQKGKGYVRLTRAEQWNSLRSLEIHDVADDGNFPELQGYFANHKSGVLSVHFALMTTDPFEPLNFALAGEKRFSVRKNGIGVWLKIENGMLSHVTAEVSQELFPVDAFRWYTIDIGYDVDAGTYDLTIYEDGEEAQEAQDEPLIALTEQKNTPDQAGSAVYMYSFIGDLDDLSNVRYYVDEIRIETDESVYQRPFIAPGRRAWAADRWAAFHQRQWKKQRCLPVLALADVGISPEAAQTLGDEGFSTLLQRLLAGQLVKSEQFKQASPHSLRLLTVFNQWNQGCTALSHGQGDDAFDAFLQAAQDVPAGKIYALSVGQALAAVGDWAEAEIELNALSGDWQGDRRFVLASAMLAVAREEWALAEDWLREPALQIQVASTNIPKNKQEGALGFLIPPARQTCMEQTFFAELYYFVLVWQAEFAMAESYAAALTGQQRVPDCSVPRWEERAGDAAFLADDYTSAQTWYEASERIYGGDSRTLSRLSDVAFLLGDMDQERVYREKAYGSLREE